VMKFVVKTWKVARVVILGLFVAGGLLGIVQEINGKMERAAAIREIDENLERNLEENRRLMEKIESERRLQEAEIESLESQLRIKEMLQDSDR